MWFTNVFISKLLRYEKRFPWRSSRNKRCSRWCLPFNKAIYHCFYWLFVMVQQQILQTIMKKVMSHSKFSSTVFLSSGGSPQMSASFCFITLFSCCSRFMLSKGKSRAVLWSLNNCSIDAPTYFFLLALHAREERAMIQWEKMLHNVDSVQFSCTSYEFVLEKLRRMKLTSWKARILRHFHESNR